MVYELPYHALQIWKTSLKSVVFTDKVDKNSRNFVGVFNKTIIPLALVRYEIIKANEAHRALLE